MILVLFLAQIAVTYSLDCSQAPTPAMQLICRQLQRWDDGARKTPATTNVKPPSIAGKDQLAAEFAPIASNMYQCMDIACLCVFFRGSGGSACSVQGQPLQKTIRKEYRQLSDDERSRFHTAMRTMKENGEYDRLATIHAQFATSGGAHSGPAFLPWHREYLKRVEIAIRQVDPSLSLPYWDSTLDQNLPNSKDSIMWTNEFMGESDSAGNVVGGPFRNWRTLENRANIRRAVGAQAKLFSDDEIQFVMQQSDISQVLSFTAPKTGCRFQPNFNVLEYTHGNPHIYVGGEMLDQSTAANDPVFFLHHSFVDLIWEQWRLGKQSRSSRERDWPPDNDQCSSQHHFSNAFMRPFPPMRNADGLSNMYTDNLYSYAPRPSCSQGNNCGSKYLFCDRSHAQPRCAAKIKAGGNCTGLNNGEDMCYNGHCEGGKCVGGSQVTPAPPISPTKPVVPPTQQTCFNEHECCSYWSSIGECPKNYIYMSQWCKASCKICTPSYDLNNECLDRHANCMTWSRSGECNKNPLWMSENCRKACNKCGISRAVTCSGGGGGQKQVTTMAPIQQTPRQSNTGGGTCNSPMCYNEDVCCPFWASIGGCRNNPQFMNCQCRVSCRQCNPNYRYGECSDYHPDCVKWSRSGECGKNKWMLENCRRSCNSCASSWDLERRCSHRATRTAFLAVLQGM